LTCRWRWIIANHLDLADEVRPFDVPLVNMLVRKVIRDKAAGASS
jgi:hypothetical protein